MKKEESFTVGVSYMILSATGLALTGFFAEMAFQSLSLTALMFWRFFAALLTTTIFLWIRGELHHMFPIPAMKMHLLRSFFVLTSQYCFYYYIEKNTLLNAMVLVNMGPLFIPIIEWGILKHHIGKSTWAGVIVSFIGIVCVLQPDAGIFSILSLIGLLAGVSQGASQVVFGLNSKSERSDVGVFYLFLLAACFTLIPYLLFHTTWVPGQEGNKWAILLIAIIGLSSMVNQLSRAIAYQHGTPSRLSAFLYFSIILAGFLDWLVYDKIPNTLSIIGAILVVLGGLLKIYLRAHILKQKN